MGSDYYSTARLPPSSSVLVALSTLVPASPPLSPSLLPASITSGEIPLLLDGLDVSINHRYSTASDLSNWRISGRTSLYASHLPQSNSCASTGTFGPIYRPSMSTHPDSDRTQRNIMTEQPGTCVDLSNPLERTVETLISNYPSVGPARQAASPVQIPCPVVKSAIDGGFSLPDERPTIDLQPTSQKERPSLKIGSDLLFPPPPTQHDDSCDTSISADCNSNPTAVKHKLRCGEKASSAFRLDKTRVVVSVDQEGFRSVSPSFKFVGCSKRVFDDKRQRAENMAQFIPFYQQTFHFHYAPLDGLPVLRRICVNDNETRDYISREATLGLKSNGIYVVHGIELATQPVNDNGSSELHWEFVYEVEDRRVGPSKKIVDGEKNLTPVSFSCSPALLHPSRGRRVNLLHIMRKSVTTKVMAEKLEMSDPQTGIQSSRRKPTSGFDKTNTHRRALSYERQPRLATGASSGTVLEQHVMNRRDLDDSDSTRNTRRRRASSAGEWNGHDSQPTTVEARVHPPIQRHIVDPTKLAQMLETRGNVPQTVVQPDLYPLAPNPRHYRQRERNGVYRLAREKNNLSSVTDAHSFIMSITHLTSTSQLDDILSKSKDKLSVIDFHATWCGPCHAIAPVYEALAKEYTNVNFLKCDVDVARDVASRYSISAMPTFIFLKGSSKVDQVRGANKSALESTLRRHASGTGSGAFGGQGQTLGSNSGPQQGDRPFENLSPQVKLLLGLFGAYILFWYLS
ncbi:hypothetical protein APHAL10511_001190 [Amanita phalloides]|nr:hypothetical protein APHAL10511_001190 [Amanita phalloides]